MPTEGDSPSTIGALAVVLNQRAATPPYHREAVVLQGDEVPGKAIGFDADGVLGAIAVGGGATLPDGVVGDGVADDTLAIQTAIDTGFCYLPARTYKITTLEMPSNAILRGAGHGTVLLSTVSGATAIIRNKVGAAAVTTGVEVSSLTISGTDGSGGTGLWLNTFTNSSFTNLRITNCRNVANTGRGLYMENAFGDCYNNAFAALTIENCDDALTLTSINAAMSCGYNFFSAVTIAQEINGIKLLLGSGHGGTYNTFTGIFFQGNNGPGIYIDISGYGNRFTGVNFDAVGAGPILKLQSTATGNFIGITSGWDPTKYQNLSSLPNTVDCAEALCYAPDKGFIVADPCADLKVFFRSPASPTGEVEINLGNATADLWKMVMQGAAAPYLQFRYGAPRILTLQSNLVSSAVNLLVGESTSLDPNVTINGAAGTERAIKGQTAGVTRWEIFLGAAFAEGGGNTGSHFRLMARADDGSAIDFPITIERQASGPIDFRRQIIVHNMTKAARNALGAVDNGTIVYQTDNTPGLRVRENGAWVKYTATADA